MGIPDADKLEDFIAALVQLQKDCGVDDLKMSDYGFTPDESMTLAVNAKEGASICVWQRTMDNRLRSAFWINNVSFFKLRGFSDTMNILGK